MMMKTMKMLRPTMTSMLAICAVLMALGAQRTAAVVTIDKSVYRDLVVEIKDNVPVAECASVLINLEVSRCESSGLVPLDGVCVCVCKIDKCRFYCKIDEFWSTSNAKMDKSNSEWMNDFVVNMIDANAMSIVESMICLSTTALPTLTTFAGTALSTSRLAKTLDLPTPGMDENTCCVCVFAAAAAKWLSCISRDHNTRSADASHRLFAQLVYDSCATVGFMMAHSGPCLSSGLKRLCF